MGWRKKGEIWWQWQNKHAERGTSREMWYERCISDEVPLWRAAERIFYIFIPVRETIATSSILAHRALSRGCVTTVANCSVCPLKATKNVWNSSKIVLCFDCSSLPYIVLCITNRIFINICYTRTAPSVFNIALFVDAIRWLFLNRVLSQSTSDRRRPYWWPLGSYLAGCDVRARLSLPRRRRSRVAISVSLIN